MINGREGRDRYELTAAQGKALRKRSPPRERILSNKSTDRANNGWTGG